MRNDKANKLRYLLMFGAIKDIEAIDRLYDELWIK